MHTNKATIINKLRQEILALEGYKPPVACGLELVGLGEVEEAFPYGIFPRAALHEMVCANTEQATAAGGFISCILSVLMKKNGICFWIGRSKRLFAPALISFGVPAHKVIFISLQKDKDALWVMEEALKCGGLTAVVCELKELNFKQSSRLQLAVEQSLVTGFILRNSADKLGSTACAARWQIKHTPSVNDDGLPGVGHMRWKVELLKVRNGNNGNWILEWQNNHFVQVKELITLEERLIG